MTKVGPLYYVVILLALIPLFLSVVHSQSDEEDEPSEEEDEDEDEDALELRSVVNANSKFAKKFYFLLDNLSPGSSFVNSPLSMSTLLSMLWTGATSDRKAELKKALQMRGLTEDVIIDGWTDLYQTFPIDDEGITYRSLERIYVPNTHDIRNAFKESIEDIFDSVIGVRIAEFSKSVTAAQRINTWIKRRTNGKLSSIISPDSISKDTKLVLVSGVYFHGAWERSFTFQSNETEYFYLNNTHGTTVRMMSQYGRFKYVNLPEMRSEAVSIPFAGERLEFIVLIPKILDGIHFPMEQAMKARNWSLASIIQRMKPKPMNLFLPKFDAESFWTFTHTDPSPTMKKLGISVDPSRRSLLDYNGLTLYPGLYLDKIIHKVVFTITERGLNPPRQPPPIGNKRKTPPITVKADHPFVYFLYDRDTKSILLMGRKTL